ncbi:MAG: oligosaccharide flippase family protein [Flavisolibacter sp.]
MNRSIIHKLISQGWLALSQIIFPLITYPIVTRALGAQALGKVNFTDSVVQMVLILAGFGIPLYGIRETAIRKNNTKAQSTLFWELFFLQLLILLPAVLLLFLLGSFSHIDHDLLWTGMIALAFSLLSCDWFLQGNEKFRFVAIRSIIIRTIGVVLIYLFVKTPKDAILYYIILTGAVVATMLLNFLKISSFMRFSFGSIKPFHHLRKISWVYACYVLASVYAVLDSLMLGWMSTESVVGYYSVGYRIVRMSAMLLPTLGLVFIPAISFQHAEADKRNMERQVRTSLYIIFIFGIPLSVSFLVLAPEIIGIFATPAFNPSIPVIRILSAVPLLVSFSHLTGTQVLVSTQKEKTYFRFLLFGCLIDLFLDLLLIPMLHEQAAAIANVATEAFLAIGTLVYLRRADFFSLPSRLIASCFFSSLLLWPLVLLMRWLNLSSLLVLVCSLLLFAAIYLSIQLRIIFKNMEL